MNTCDTCKHWTQGGQRGNASFGSCGCHKFEMGYKSAKESALDCVIVESDEGWGFETGPKFGCIHQEPKS